MRVTQAPSFRDCSASLCRPLLPPFCTYIPLPPPFIVFVPSTLARHPLCSSCILIDLFCLLLTATTMAVSILGKRSRGAPDLEEQKQQQHSTRRCTRLTRSFQQGNDENEDPESTLSLEAEDQSESEDAFFSPSVTRTPSARRTKDVFKFEASDYRGLLSPLGSRPSPADSFPKQLPRSQ